MPRSMFEIVITETSTNSASRSCVIPERFLNFAVLRPKRCRSDSVLMVSRGSKLKSMSVRKRSSHKVKL